VKRGISMRYITDIGVENISYCKMMTKNGHQLRHLPGIKTNFAIADRYEYMANIVLEKEKPLWQVLVSNVKTFVEGQQSIFDTLWNRALPAEQRIREIEEGVTPEFTERLTDPSEIQKITFDLVRSAKEEIKIIFFTVNAFKRQEHSGLMWLLQKTDPSVTVRILIPTAFELDEKMKRNFVYRKIEIRNFVNSSLKAIFTTLMVDAKLCFELENKDEKDNSYEPSQLNLRTNTRY
jgi:two-component system sensor histidine kinase VicK